MTDNQNSVEEIITILASGERKTTPWLRFNSGKDKVSLRVNDLDKGKVDLNVFHGTQDRNGTAVRVQIDAAQIDEVIEALLLLKRVANLD